MLGKMNLIKFEACTMLQLVHICILLIKLNTVTANITFWTIGYVVEHLLYNMAGIRSNLTGQDKIVNQWMVPWAINTTCTFTFMYSITTGIYST